MQQIFPFLQRIERGLVSNASRLLEDTDALCVLAPHPDDETLGCGQLLRAAATLQIPTLVVCVTDGAASHPGSENWRPGLIAEVRAEEFDRAVSILGRNIETVSLGHSDGRLADADTDRLNNELLQLFDRYAIDTVCTTWSGDPHIDHKHTNKACHEAVALGETERRIFEYPIWGRFLDIDNAPPDNRVIRIDCGDTARHFKRTALGAYESQMTRLIDDDQDGFCMEDWMQEHFCEAPEIFFATS